VKLGSASNSRQKGALSSPAQRQIQAQKTLKRHDWINCVQSGLRSVVPGLLKGAEGRQRRYPHNPGSLLIIKARSGEMQSNSSHSPTVSPPQPTGLNSALARNIDALRERHQREEEEASLQEKLAGLVTAFTGSMTFVYVHLVILVAWVSMNTGLIQGAPRFDRTFVILATAASVEAIFLSTFVLISQNRAAKAADRRAGLDLQINLLTEHEVTRLIKLTAAIAEKLEVGEIDDPGLQELQRDVAPEAVLDTLEKEEE
jgi:uncharacterized membrane protein